MRDGMRYCTACGAAVNGISADSELRVKPRNHVAVILACMLVIGIVGGSCMGLHLRQVLSHFVSAHSEHAIVLDVAAAGWDTDNGASRVPIHITGKTIDGITVDRIEFVASDGSGINLIQGVYTLEAAGSPIAADGTIYQIPCTSATLVLDAADVTNDEIYDAALLAMTYRGGDAPDVAALCQAAINRRDGASTSGNAFESCGEMRIN